MEIIPPVNISHKAVSCSTSKKSLLSSSKDMLFLMRLLRGVVLPQMIRARDNLNVDMRGQHGKTTTTLASS